MTAAPASQMTAKNVLAPRTTEVEFGGFAGALFISTTVPLTAYYFALGCNDVLGCALSLPVSNTDAFVEYVRETLGASFTYGTAWALYTGWYLYCVLAWYFLPGKWVKGLPLRTGQQLEYKTNGKWCGSHSTGYGSRRASCCCRIHHCVRTGKLHHPVRPLARPSECRTDQLHRTSSVRVCGLVLWLQASCAWRKHRQCRV